MVKKLIITWLIKLFSNFLVNTMQAIIFLRLGFTFQSSLMLIAFLCIMTVFKSIFLTKTQYFQIILSKYLNFGKMQLSKCLFCTSSQATFVISLQSLKEKLRWLKKQLLWPRKQKSTPCFVKHWWMNASLRNPM